MIPPHYLGPTPVRGLFVFAAYDAPKGFPGGAAISRIRSGAEWGFEGRR